MSDAYDLAVQEYFHLSSILESYDEKILTIKGWGVTVSLVLLGTAVLRKSRPTLLVSGLGAVAFWLLEAYYGIIARAHADRVVELERSLRTGSAAVPSPAIYSSWSENFTWSDLTYRLFNVQTLVPNLLVVAVAAILFVTTRDSPGWSVAAKHEEK